MKEDYETMVEALEGLKKAGYTHNFQAHKDKLECTTDNTFLIPENCTVDKTYRFEGESNPSDMSIVYAISSKDGKHKGALVTAYGMYSEPMTDDMVQLLKMDHRD